MENKVLKAKFGSDKTPLYLGELSIPWRLSKDWDNRHYPKS